MGKNSVRAAVCSDVGRRRNNEDNFYLNGQYMPMDQMDQGGVFTCESQGPQVYAVFDGMGGCECGEWASSTAAQMLAYGVKTGQCSTVGNLMRLLEQVSHRIYQKFEGRSGTTVALVAFSGGRVFLLNIGDSRIYRLRCGRFQQVSRDHSGVENHSITNYLGIIPEDRLPPHTRMDDVGEWTIAAGTDTDTVYLLCSDGLTDTLSDGDIRQILLNNPNPEMACRALKQAALQRGVASQDNLTCMVVRAPQDMVTVRRGGGWWQTLLQVVLAAGALGSLLMFILQLLK